MKSAVKMILTGLMTLSAMTPVFAGSKSKNVTFEMIRSPGLPALPSACIPKAIATVTIVPGGPTETMTVKVSGLPANTDFDFFVIQVPNKPFGMSWYMGDIQTNSKGEGQGTFIGRFSIETFVVAPGSVPAEVPEDFSGGMFPDASTNPVTSPLQMYHLGLWFDNPSDATKAGCPGTETPFNGEHNAGVQALNTSNFPVGGPTNSPAGPLLNVE
jgi:hypothetical protein